MGAGLGYILRRLRPQERSSILVETIAYLPVMCLFAFSFLQNKTPILCVQMLSNFPSPPP